MSTQKQNRAPCKQGAFYQLSLGKNNGPFLSKDIMYSNRKSMTLLTNKQILKSHQTMVNTINTLQRNKKQISFTPQQVQNFNGIFTFCHDQLKSFDSLSNQLYLSQKLLHKQFQQMNKRINLTITTLYQTSMPAMKAFFKKVKQNNTKDKQQNYQLKKQVEKISFDTNILSQGIVQCKNKIQQLEKFFEKKDGYNDEY